MPERRDTLRIIGAIGATCAFPSAGNELYGQHAEHAAAHTTGAQAPTGPRKFFTDAEFALLSVLTDVLIPATDTPGATEAGVPGYIDLVVNANPEHRKLMREGLAWLAAQGFAAKDAAGRVAILTPLSDVLDKGRVKTMPERFFRLAKSLTCDGYFTSQIGMSRTLGFTGASMRETYASCEIPEH
ncbi:MAG: gluconate 2-dehydrogenase subunit 3 family protein [Bryobacteraceae bacterium]|nr:gluconate 2-dehydrogenase subunit 3 family protein [Bryobacteraceae bacterium]